MAHWDELLTRAAEVAQLTGLDAIVVITFVVKYLRITRNSDECHKLKERVRKLRAQLRWPSSSELEAGSPVRALLEALDEAAGLVDSYTKSALWRRVLHGRRLANRFRDAQSGIDSCFGAVVFFNLRVHPWTSDVRLDILEVEKYEMSRVSSTPS
jgi:hypothetical protein